MVLASCKEKRMKKVVTSLAVAALLVLSTSTAWAFGRHRGCEAPCESSGGSSCGAAVGYGDIGCGCAAPQYHTEYREVKRTVYRQVPETVEKDVTETVQVPVTHEETRTRTYWVPVTKQETRQRQVCHLETRTEEREQTVLVAQTREVEQHYSVCIPETHMETRQTTVQVAVMHPETRHVTCTVYHNVPEVVPRQVVSCRKVPTYALAVASAVARRFRKFTTSAPPSCVVCPRRRPVK